MLALELCGALSGGGLMELLQSTYLYAVAALAMTFIGFCVPKYDAGREPFLDVLSPSHRRSP